MKTIKCYCVRVFLCCSVIGLLGCETIEEGAKGVIGISTRALEKARKDAIVKTFNYDYATCYAMTQEALKHMHAYIYAHNMKKHMIAVYVSEEDTTPVGIFFQEIDKANTQVEVSSLSTYAKEFISEKFFSVLEKKITVDQLEVQFNAEKKKGIK